MTSKAHIKAVLLALFVTFLWSTSWVLVKIGLKASLPAITFAGLRYSIAFLCLIPFILLNPVHRKVLQSISRTTWGQLALLGIVFYTLTQGAQFVSLSFLPAATLSLLLNFSPIFVALPSGLLQDESPSIIQWGGIILSAAGAIVYFLPLNISTGQVLGLMIAFIGVLANSGSSLLGRRVNHQSGLAPVLVTAISMGIGGLLLLVIGTTIQGFGKLNLMQWLIIGWLAVVNTAIAFTLWNNALKTLTAVESSIINNTMLPQIAILAWLFLDEPLNPRKILGIVLVGAGTLIVQLWRHLPGVVKSMAVKPE
jgi:drug/metabolite transporter (DMT)-like permease